MMIYEDLKKSVEEIKMTDEMKNRIIKNCYLKTSEKEKYVMKKTNKGFKKMLPLVAVMVICVISVGAVVANHFRGYKDVTKGTAVVGTVYEEATEMIEIDVEVKNNLVVSASVVDYTKPPYIEIDVIDINSYKIVDNSNNIISKGTAKSISDFENGKVTFEIPLDDIASGEYKLIINEFVGSKKADQPLSIKGEWECVFVK